MFYVYVKTSKNSYFLIYGILIYSADRVKIRYVVKTKAAWISFSLKLIHGFELYNDLNLIQSSVTAVAAANFELSS